MIALVFNCCRFLNSQIVAPQLAFETNSALPAIKLSSLQLHELLARFQQSLDAKYLSFAQLSVAMP